MRRKIGHFVGTPLRRFWANLRTCAQSVPNTG